MAAPRYQTLVAGVRRLVAAITSSAGAADAEKIVATGLDGILDDTIMGAAETGASVVLKTRVDGTIDPTTLPSGVGASTVSIPASEALDATNVVNVWNDAGTARVRKANATTEGQEAHGYVLEAVAALGTATVYFDDRITGLTGKTPGARQYLSTTAGLMTETAPSTTGNIVQHLGNAYSATAVNFEPSDPITLV